MEKSLKQKVLSLKYKQLNKEVTMELDKNEQIKNQIIEKLRTIPDKEVPISIYDLGLVYKIDLDESKNVLIDMTMINTRVTSTKSLTDLIESKVLEIDGLQSCKVKFVYSPKWEVTMITEEGLEQLRNAAKQ